MTTYQYWFVSGNKCPMWKQDVNNSGSSVCVGGGYTGTLYAICSISYKPQSVLKKRKHLLKNTLQHVSSLGNSTHVMVIPIPTDPYAPWTLDNPSRREILCAAFCFPFPEPRSSPFLSSCQAIIKKSKQAGSFEWLHKSGRSLCHRLGQESASWDYLIIRDPPLPWRFAKSYYWTEALLLI